MPGAPPEVLDYVEKNRERFVADLVEFCRFASISAVPKHAPDVRRSAEWTARHLSAIGVPATVEETAGHPSVLAEHCKAPGAPTVLVYGHHDVQPVDPLDQWKSGPFEPVVRDGRLWARGASDDKGQVLAHVKSAEAWLRAAGRLPVNLKFYIEGEEEFGSRNAPAFVEKHRKRLACDVAIVSDGFQFARGVPAITTGLRGIALFEVTLRGPSQDLHSGVFGGSVMNPAHALAGLVAALVSADGVVQVPGFYNDVAPLERWEREEYARLPFDEKAYLAGLGVGAPSGERGYTTLERRWARPTCDVNGLWGGYQGEGTKTIIPAAASAKISFRLVPNQDPKKIGPALRRFLEERLPPGVRMEFKEWDSKAAIVYPRELPAIQAAARAIEAGFGARPVFIREGGSVPIVNWFKTVLGADSLLLGWGIPDAQVHSPNENLWLDEYHKSIRACAHLWSMMAN
jgi:acetylornithine deacetylase/succinyl-diaminopimelate desuccinylase-like protein